MAASLSDILTTGQNIAQAINTLAQTYLIVQGLQNRAAITGGAVLIKQGAGRVASVSVIAAGSADGAIYDAKLVDATSNQIYVIPQTPGVFVVNLPVGFGIVVAPGTDQVVTVSYS